MLLSPESLSAQGQSAQKHCCVHPDCVSRGQGLYGKCSMGLHRLAGALWVPGVPRAQRGQTCVQLGVVEHHTEHVLVGRTAAELCTEPMLSPKQIPETRRGNSLLPFIHCFHLTWYFLDPPERQGAEHLWLRMCLCCFQCSQKHQQQGLEKLVSKCISSIQTPVQLCRYWELGECTHQGLLQNQWGMFRMDSRKNVF